MQLKTLTASKEKLIKYVLVFVLSVMVIACGKKHEDEKSTQSLVSVNGEEITVYQLNNELLRVKFQPTQKDLVSKQIIQGLIDRQILIEAAKEEKLDQKPAVMQLIENSKSQLLAQAYLESRLSSISKPNKTEIDNYRSEHGNIFANRKIYLTDQIVFKLGPEQINEMRSIVKLGSQKELEEWLKARGIKSILKHAEISPETLQPQLLPQFSKMKIGQMVFINSRDPEGVTEAIVLTGLKDSPISEKDSAPIIEKILVQQKKKFGN
jgi:EpsD family peptidyl-prolyl cis-trans isomerase